MKTDKSLIPSERIQGLILMVRGHKVLLDRDLAVLCGVETRVLNQAARRNRERFPSDFMFELTRDEITRISQIVTSSNLKFSKRVTVFTEQGVAMLSSILRSKRAIAVNIEIMRVLVRLRELLASNRELADKLNELERYVLNSRQTNSNYLRSDPAAYQSREDITPADWLSIKEEIKPKLRSRSERT